MGSMGNRQQHPLLFQHSMQLTAGVNVVILPTHLKTFVKPRKTLPFFSGAERGALIEDWLQECEKTAAILRWTDSQKLQEFARKLSGDARVFHETKLKSVKDYKMWRELMTNNFAKKDKDFFVKQLMDLKQKPNQSVRKFAQEINSLMVKTLGLAVVTSRLHRTFCLDTKLAYFSDGLREDVSIHLNSVILNNQGRMPFWSRIVEQAQDFEWLIDLQRKKTSANFAPQWNGEGYAKVYITISEEKNYRYKLTGYSVFFGNNDDPKNIYKVYKSTNNATLIVAAIYAIKTAKDCGMDRLIIYTNSEYLLKFVDEWAVSWLERKWFRICNVNLWRDLLANLDGIDVKWKKPADAHEISCFEASRLFAKLAKSKYLEQQLKRK